MPAMKRPAAAPVAAGKRPKADPVIQKAEKLRASVLSALEKAELSSASLDILRSVLPMALQPLPRHAFQEQAVEMLEREFESIEKSFEARLAELETSLSSAEAKRAELQASVDTAQAAADAKSGAASETKEALDQAAAKFREANEAKSKEELARTQLLESIEGAGQKLELLKTTSAMKASLLNGEEGSSAELLDSNLRLLLQDSNLLDAVQKCTRKSPGEHSNFEKLVLQQVDGQLGALEKQLLALQSEGDAKKEQAETKIAEAVAILDACLETKASAQETFRAASEAKREAEKAAKAAKADLKAFEASVPGMQKKLESSRSQLASFISGPKTNFRTLKNGEAPGTEKVEVGQDMSVDVIAAKVTEEAGESILPLAEASA